jgi:hypothetical protein
MSLFTAWIIFPLVLLALCTGLGLLVDVACGRRLPGVLVPPMGLAALVVVGDFTTATDATAELTVPLVLVLAVLGAGLSLPWRFGRPDPLPIAVAVSVFVVFGAPVILSGNPTFAGFIMLDDTATWLAMTDRIMEHSRSLAGLEGSSYYATLEFNLAAGYPIGAFIPFGTAQKLVGGDLAWVFQPYLSFLAAMLSLGLWQVLGIVSRPRLRALAVFTAAQPALLFGYVMWGGVKEVAAAALLPLTAALASAAVRRDATLRDVLPFTIAAAALVGVLSPGGLAWLSPMLLMLLVLAVYRFGLRATLVRAGLFVASLAALTIPVLTSGLVPPTSKPLVGSDGEGNLRGPLDPFQVFGVWPSGDFRVDPDGTVVTAVLVALAIGGALLGLWAAWRRRNATPLLYASTLIAAAAIVILGSPWAGGKALATASPVALSLAVLGALAAVQLDRVAGGMLMIAIVGGVLWSNVVAYGGVSLAPYDQLVELEQIGKEFSGQGPALMTEYHPYGARHFLRTLDGESASELRTRAVSRRGGGEVDKGYSVDTDELDLDGLLEFRTLVLRRSPVRSRPPSLYRPVFSGDHYEVWQRPVEPSVRILHHMSLGDEETYEPSGLPDCGELGGLELMALSNQLGATPQDVSLIAVRHAPVINATDGVLRIPRSATYAAWLKGSTRSEIELYVDNDKFGDARHEINNEGSFIYLGEMQLRRGDHKAELRFGDPDLHPGSAGPREAVGPLLFAPVGADLGEVVKVRLDQLEQLCGKRWDWIEAVG